MEKFLQEYALHAVFALMVLEFVLGKTKLVKANSSFEVVLNMIVSILRLFYPKKDELEIDIKK